MPRKLIQNCLQPGYKPLFFVLFGGFAFWEVFLFVCLGGGLGNTRN
jgi:hypothetical protein